MTCVHGSFSDTDSYSCCVVLNTQQDINWIGLMRFAHTFGSVTKVVVLTQLALDKTNLAMGTDQK